MSEEMTVADRIDKFATEKAHADFKRLKESLFREAHQAWGKGYSDEDTSAMNASIGNAVDLLEDRFVGFRKSQYLKSFFANYKALTEFFDRIEDPNKEG